MSLALKRKGRPGGARRPMLTPCVTRQGANGGKIYFAATTALVAGAFSFANSISAFDFNRLLAA